MVSIVLTVFKIKYRKSSETIPCFKLASNTNRELLPPKIKNSDGLFTQTVFTNKRVEIVV